MSDTIAAAATGGGVSAIGVIRISGGNAISAADSIFRAKNGIKMSDAEDRKLVYGTLMGTDGDVVDICLCTVSRGPNSYTGEDTAEFHCHGSPVVLSEALRSLFETGVRQAEAGEFTKRAFLNGRMDLSQAEAVIDLIESETAAAAKNAAGQLQGAIGNKINAVYDALLDMSAHFFAVIDYPDEDIEDFQIAGYLDTLNGAENVLFTLLSTFDRGRIMKDGVSAAIIGRPNTGKSSLLNALLGYDRAIVTDIAGTTRDTIEEKVRLGSLLLRLSDTAGIRHTEDVVEKLGVGRAREAAARAQLVLAVFDGSSILTEDDEAVLSIAENAERRIAVINKSDLPLKINAHEIEKRLGPVCFVSSIGGEGLDGLADMALRMFGDGAAPCAGELLTNERQAAAVGRAADSLRQAKTALQAGVTPDAVLTEIEAAMSALGEITGKTVRDDVTNRIFERFCVGK
jgi:tRNA modification GTPase